MIGITLLILFLFVFKSKKDLIIGTWQEVKENGNGSYTKFNKDDTVDLFIGQDRKATYKIDGDTLIISLDSISQSYIIDELTSDKLVLKQTYNGKTEEVTFKKVDDTQAVQTTNDKAALKTANSNAKLIYVTCNNEASDLIADGERVDKLVYSGPVSGLTGVLGNAVKQALKGNDADSGYVYIYFDPNADYNSDKNFAQWSASEDGIIGQYPNQPKTVDDAKKVTFGEKYKS